MNSEHDLLHSVDKFVLWQLKDQHKQVLDLMLQIKHEILYLSFRVGELYEYKRYFYENEDINYYWDGIINAIQFTKIIGRLLYFNLDFEFFIKLLEAKTNSEWLNLFRCKIELDSDELYKLKNHEIMTNYI